MEPANQKPIPEIHGFISDHELVHDLRKMAIEAFDINELDNMIRNKINCKTDESMRLIIYFRLAFFLTIGEAMEVVENIKQGNNDTASYIITSHAQEWN